ncbi:hypothetical protein PR048_004755 [Dryococelus australis]|uniref:Uncharacterized protein n=1 Tax=Dryococelus australis TaxID=614101 RepID=A0ABQ9I6B7_9NEOP|nr:hypothetical protein PR048_004755 [Dryococelus australis]
MVNECNFYTYGWGTNRRIDRRIGIDRRPGTHGTAKCPTPGDGPCPKTVLMGVTGPVDRAGPAPWPCVFHSMPQWSTRMCLEPVTGRAQRAVANPTGDPLPSNGPVRAFKRAGPGQCPCVCCPMPLHVSSNGRAGPAPWSLPCVRGLRIDMGCCGLRRKIAARIVEHVAKDWCELVWISVEGWCVDWYVLVCVNWCGLLIEVLIAMLIAVLIVGKGEHLRERRDILMKKGKFEGEMAVGRPELQSMDSSGAPTPDADECALEGGSTRVVGRLLGWEVTLPCLSSLKNDIERDSRMKKQRIMLVEELATTGETPWPSTTSAMLSTCGNPDSGVETMPLAAVIGDQRVVYAIVKVPTMKEGKHFPSVSKSTVVCNTFGNCSHIFLIGLQARFHMRIIYRLFTLQDWNHLITLAFHQAEPGPIPGRVTGFSQLRIVPDDAVGWRVLSGSPVSPPLHSGADPYSLQSPSSALKTSLVRGGYSQNAFIVTVNRYRVGVNFSRQQMSRLVSCKPVKKSRMGNEPRAR